MKTKHTPGPWEIVLQSGAGPMIAHRFDTGKQMNPTGLRLIAHMLERGNTFLEDRANAQLIANAPRYYDALVSIVDSLKPHDGQIVDATASKMQWIAIKALGLDAQSETEAK